MDTATVDSFNSRLMAELSALSWQDRNDLLSRIGRQEQRMRSDGQERPVWRGPLAEHELLGRDVVVQTEQGERRGRAICYGIVSNGELYERSVVVHVPSSGTQHEAPGSAVRLASPEDLERMENERVMAERLVEASYAALRGPKRPEEALRLQRKRGLKDPELIKKMVEAARRHPGVMFVDEGPVNFKITGSAAIGPQGPSKRIYVFKAQLRVDISGFDVDHAAIRRVSDDEARDMHLGRVRGQILFDDREKAFEAFEAALGGLQ